MALLGGPHALLHATCPPLASLVLAPIGLAVLGAHTITPVPPSAAGSTAAEQAQLALLSPGYTYVCDTVAAGLAALLEGLRRYEGHSRLLGWWHDTFTDLVGGQLQGLLLSLARHCMELAQVKVRGAVVMGMCVAVSAGGQRGGGRAGGVHVVAACNPAPAPPALWPA